MHTTIWSNHSQCISLYINKTLRSFGISIILTFALFPPWHVMMKIASWKKKFRDETPWGTNPIPPSPRKLWQNQALYSFVFLWLSQSQIRPNIGEILVFNSWISYIRKVVESSCTEQNFGNLGSLKITKIQIFYLCINCTFHKPSFSPFWSQCFKPIIAIAEVMGRGISCP